MQWPLAQENYAIRPFLHVAHYIRGLGSTPSYDGDGDGKMPCG
jgi:hypothetical protein